MVFVSHWMLFVSFLRHSPSHFPEGNLVLSTSINTTLYEVPGTRYHRGTTYLVYNKDKEDTAVVSTTGSHGLHQESVQVGPLSRARLNFASHVQKCCSTTAVFSCWRRVAGEPVILLRAHENMFRCCCPGAHHNCLLIHQSCQRCRRRV